MEGKVWKLRNEYIIVLYLDILCLETLEQQILKCRK